MQQKKELNHTEVISIEEYLTKRKGSGIWTKARDGEASRRRTTHWHWYPVSLGIRRSKVSVYIRDRGPAGSYI